MNAAGAAKVGAMVAGTVRSISESGAVLDIFTTSGTLRASMAAEHLSDIKGGSDLETRYLVISEL